MHPPPPQGEAPLCWASPWAHAASHGASHAPGAKRAAHLRSFPPQANNCSRNWYFGRVCPHTTTLLRSLAAELLASAPHKPSRLPLPDHWLTQSYFLSATDFDGTPLAVRFLGKLETFRDDFAQLLVPLSLASNRRPACTSG